MTDRFTVAGCDSCGGGITVMEYFGKGKKSIVKILAAIISLSVLVNCVSCSEEKTKNHSTSDPEKPEYMFIISDDTPNCSIILSDEVFNYLSENSHYSYILDMMSDYFNVVINDEIDPNIVYVKAVTDKIDAEVRLAEIYDPSNKISLIVQIAEAGKTVLPSFVDDTEDGAIVDISEIMNPTDSKNVFYSAVKSSLKTVADKGSLFSVKAIKDELKEKTAKIYDTPGKIIREGNVGQLKYNDYFINIDSDNGISIVCGSQESVIEALNYFLTEYIQMGTSKEGDYIVNVPDQRIHVGHYLKGEIAEKPVSDYSIIYYCDKTYYDSRDNAKYLKQYFLKNFGVDLFLKDSDSARDIKYKIVIGKTRLALSDKFYSENNDIMSYKILHQGSDLYIMGGSDWAIKYAIDYLIDEFFSKEIPVPMGYSKEGNIYGEYLFPNYGDSKLRIMSNNVWNCNFNMWYGTGETSFCIDRFKKMAKVYLAYNPDIISFQELHPRFASNMMYEINQQDRHYSMVDTSKIGTAVKNYTPIAYNDDTMTLLDSGSHVFTYGSNSDTKSYTWGYFEMKETGFRFIAFSTHLWWQSDKSTAGSSNWRAQQMSEICQKANELIRQYSCPCFVMGDFNCKITSKEYSVMGSYHFSDCHSIATEYASNESGRYVCNNTSFSYKPNAGTFKKNAIDHIFVENLKKASVLSYDYALPNFFGKLSDHAPVYIDVSLN